MNNHDKIIKEAEEKISGIDKKMQELEEQNRKIFHPPPCRGYRHRRCRWIRNLGS